MEKQVTHRDSPAGIVLAAGAGSRYGMPKVLADGGAWLVAAVTALADGGCGDVVVVLGAGGDNVVEVPPPARVVHARDWADGLSASLRTGLLAVDADFAVVTTVDTPGVGAAAVRRVVDAARFAPSGLARAVYGMRPGHPVVLARQHWPAVIASLAGDVGAGPYLAARSDVVTVDCADLNSGDDVDRP